MVLKRIRENGWRQTLDEFDITKALGISFIHLMALYAPIFTIFYLGFWEFVVCLGLTVILFVFFGQGITLCYHRLLTHKSFKTSPWFRYLLTVIALCNWEGGPIYWVGNHRIHHKYSDHEGDPHSPTDGNWWAHMFWIFFKRPEGKDPWEYTKDDLQTEPVMMFLNKYFWLPQFLVMPLLYWAGYSLFPSKPIVMGIAWVLWGVGVRSFAVYHVTWIINSICHLKKYGYTNFQTKDNSRNNHLAGILGMGEGYHSNHHKYPWSAAHGMFRGEFDLTYQIIRFLESAHLVWDVMKPNISKSRVVLNKTFNWPPPKPELESQPEPES